MARFEDCINDTEIFRLLLEGFLARWNGVFDVMVATPTPGYLYEPRPDDSAFCSRVRSSPKGNELCVDCDIEHMELARQEGQPICYVCHAGMVDIAVPLIVDGELVAVILCGQCRSDNPTWETEAQRKVESASVALNIPLQELQNLRNRAQFVPTREIERVKEQLCKVANWTAGIGHERLELQRSRIAYQRESQHIQTILAELTVDEVDAFWAKLDDALQQICQTIGADHAAFLVSDDREPTRTYQLKSTGYLDKQGFWKEYSPTQLSSIPDVNFNGAEVIEFETCRGSFAEHLVSVTGQTPEKVLRVPFTLSRNRMALMLFFLSRKRDVAFSLPAEREVVLLSQITPQLTTAFENCELFTKQGELSREKDVFLEDIAHQLITPLAGIQADSDRLYRHLVDWDDSRIANQVYAIRSMSRWAAQLTRNLVWVSARGGHKLDRLELEPLTPLLIACAIDVQGTAAYKSIRVHVDEALTDPLPKVPMDRTRIAQVIVNLLDNAVKYADRGTEVLITGKEQDGWALITVSDYGIPLRKRDIERIFDRGFRTQAARQKVPGGTGIGLAVSRDIARLHGGDLSAEPSVYDRVAGKHKVTLTLKLKISPQEQTT